MLFKLIFDQIAIFIHYMGKNFSGSPFFLETLKLFHRDQFRIDQR